MGYSTDIDSLIPRQVLEAEPWPSYVLDREGRLAYMNAAWDRVASGACGLDARTVLGTRWIDHIAGAEVRAYYQALRDRIMQSGVGERHTCPCNTAELFRLYSDRFDPLRSPGSRAPAGILVVTSELASHPIAEEYPLQPAEDSRYRQPNGLLLQCSGCRRTSVASSEPRRWEFVPQFVAVPRADVSHSICPTCREVYYGMHARPSVL